MGAHKDSGWDPRPQELTKRRGVLEESRDRPRSPSGGERRPSAEAVRRSAEAVRGVRPQESGGRPRRPSGGERRPSAESAGALGRHSCGEGRAVTTSVSWAEARDVARG